MKNLNYYLGIHSAGINDGSYVSLLQDHISGGRISREQIDAIKRHPKATAVSISGLVQDTFDYFIENYGGQFKAINFWKCALVQDLSSIEMLSRIEYITYYWNQRAEALWDFSKTKALKGFSFNDFTRMHDLSQISASPGLEELDFGNMVWTKYMLNSLEPLGACTGLVNLSFGAKKVLDNRIEPLANLQRLEKLEFPSNMFSTQQVAWLKAHLPASVNSRVLAPYWQIERPIAMSGKRKDTFVVGKRKPFLDSARDKKRLDRYVKQFNDMLQWYSENPGAGPEDYSPD